MPKSAKQSEQNEARQYF